MLLRTTSRSWAMGARISNVTRWLGVQYWRSPSRTFRTSLKLRLSTGVSGPTTIAISPATPAPQAGVSHPADASSIAPQRQYAEIFNTQLLLYKWGRLGETETQNRPKIITVWRLRSQNRTWRS